MANIDIEGTSPMLRGRSGAISFRTWPAPFRCSISRRRQLKTCHPLAKYSLSCVACSRGAPVSLALADQARKQIAVRFAFLHPVTGRHVERGTAASLVGDTSLALPMPPRNDGAAAQRRLSTGERMGSGRSASCTHHPSLATPSGSVSNAKQRAPATNS